MSRSTTPLHTVIVAVMLGAGMVASSVNGAELAPDVANRRQSGQKQPILIHFEPGPEAGLVLDRRPGEAQRRRLESIDRTLKNGLADLSHPIAVGELRIHRSFLLQPTVAAVATPAGIDALLADPRIRLVEPDRRLNLQTLEGLELIRASTLHQLGFSGAGTAIAVLDSGVDYHHPTLGGGQIPNAKVIYGLDTADGDNDPMDCIGHGTAVASVAAGSSYQWSPNRRFAGGVAPAAKVLAYKVTSDSQCDAASTSAVVAAIEDAVLHREGPGYHLVAINISLGGGEFSGPCDAENTAYASAVDTAVGAGIMVVTAAGNNGYPDALNAPACLSRATAVGSAWDVDPGFIPYRFCLDDGCERWCDDSYKWQRTVACYSNSNPFLDLIAPSEYLRAAEAGGITVDFGGTSGAAAYVTGAAALIDEALGGSDPTTTTFLLASTGVPSMDDKNGLIRPVLDLASAVEAASRVSVSPETDLLIRHLPDDPTESVLVVATDGIVGHLEVLVDLTHPAPDLLRITLTSPDGTAAVLHEHGTPGDGVSGSYPNDLQPVESLARFSGVSMLGSWVLTIEDLRSGVTGNESARLIGWALKIEQPEEPPYDETTMVFPVVAHVGGVLDTEWRSDLRIFNAAPNREAELTLHLLPPSGSDAFAPRQTSLIVPHSSVIALDDVVKERLDLDPAQGSLLVQDTTGEVLHGTSRTYTTSEVGTFGQFVAPVVKGENSAGAGDPAVIVLPTAGLDHRVNIGVTEVTGKPVTVAITVIDSESGVALGPSIFTAIEAYANTQLNGFFPDPGESASADPYIAITTVQGEGRVTAYGSVIDNRSGDAVFIVGATPVVTSELLLPVVARNQGQSGTQWRSDLRVLNGGSFSIHVDAELRFQGAFGMPPVVESFELRPGQAVTFDDVIHSLFGFETAVGSLRLVPREGPAVLFATSRTANHGGAHGTYGQYVPALIGGAGIHDHGVLLHVEDGPRMRTNLGLLETSGQSVTLEITLLDHNGYPCGAVTRQTLGPWESNQINDIFSVLGAAPHPNARLEVTRLSGAGAFFGYASVVDADSGDAVFVSAQDLSSP